MKPFVRWCRLSVIAALPLFMMLVYTAGPTPKAHAGFWSDLKSIYDTPAKVDELEKQYKDSIDRLQEFSDKQAELEDLQQELTRQNEEYRLQNERLLEQNRELEAKMQQAEERGAALKQGIAWTVLAVSAALLAYMAATRIWRYRVYRSQRRDEGGTAL